MHDHVAVIHQHPAVARQAFFPAFLAMFLAHIFQYRIGQRVQHAVAGAGAQHEIIGERNNIFEIEQDDIFAFFIFERVDEFTSKIECIQGCLIEI